MISGFLEQLRARRALGVLCATHPDREVWRQTRRARRIPRSLPTLSAAIASLAAYLIAPAAAAVPALVYLFVTQRRDAARHARANRFAGDLPPLLLATASLLKSGLALHDALGRAADALPPHSACRTECLALLGRCNQTTSLEDTIEDFGREIALPELAMFRSALALASTHGGRFSDCLSRLARISADRALLIRSASAATAQMRLTASILLGVTPLFLALAYMRGGIALQALSDRPLAFSVAFTGMLLILGSYLVLLHMSDFKP